MIKKRRHTDPFLNHADAGRRRQAELALLSPDELGRIRGGSGNGTVGVFGEVLLAEGMTGGAGFVA